MNFLGIVPARYASSRFPGKPLANLGGKTMISRVVEQASKALEHVVVATDDQRIFDAVKSFGGNVVMTSGQHNSGTDRCAEALDIYEKESGESFDAVVNIQGDEPFIQPEQLKQIMSCFSDPSTQIATLVKKAEKNDEISNSNRPKVVINKNKQALYFSRSVIPYFRGDDLQNWYRRHTYYLHVGLYAYTSSVLRQITKLSPSGLELAESLEQLRWLENGYIIKTEITPYESLGIDTPEDLEKLKSAGYFDKV
jgi:3-deoxy-manno-octulosonate cytidylyltransferase (CMP-KDO synthetase)